MIPEVSIYASVIITVITKVSVILTIVTEVSVWVVVTEVSISVNLYPSAAYASLVSPVRSKSGIIRTNVTLLFNLGLIACQDYFSHFELCMCQHEDTSESDHFVYVFACFCFLLLLFL